MIKVVCVRTVFFDSPKNDGKPTKWTRNKTYILNKVDSKYTESLHLIGYIETDMIMDKDHHVVKAGDTYYSPVTEKEYKKYFTTIQDFRNKKIEYILNNDKDNSDDFIGY